MRRPLGAYTPFILRRTVTVAIAIPASRKKGMILTRKLLLVPLALVLLVAACGGDDGDNDSNDGDAEAVQASSFSVDDDVVTIETDEGTISIGGEDLPDGFPTALVYPGAGLETSFAVGDDRFVVIFRTTDDVDDVLDFYEDAFDDVGLGDDGERFSTDEFGSYSVGDEDTGSGALFEANAAENGDNLVTVGYFSR